MTSLVAQYDGQLVSIDSYNDAMKGKVTCRTCGGELVAKRGDIKVHHFAHKRRNCDDWKTGPMTEWHKRWQSLCNPKYTEVKIEKDGIYHIADIQTPKGLVIEIQHSPLNNGREREKFYGRLIWILDGNDKHVILQGENFIYMKGPAYWDQLHSVFIDVGGILYRRVESGALTMGVAIDRLQFVETMFEGSLVEGWRTRLSPPAKVSNLRLRWEHDEEPVTYITGNTYPFRKSLRAAGFDWNGNDWRQPMLGVNLSRISARKLLQMNSRHKLQCYICGREDGKFEWMTWCEPPFFIHEPRIEDQSGRFIFCRGCRRDLVVDSNEVLEGNVIIIFRDGERLVGDWNAKEIRYSDNSQGSCGGSCLLNHCDGSCLAGSRCRGARECRYNCRHVACPNYKYCREVTTLCCMSAHGGFCMKCAVSEYCR